MPEFKFCDDPNCYGCKVSSEFYAKFGIEDLKKFSDNQETTKALADLCRLVLETEHCSLKTLTDVDIAYRLMVAAANYGYVSGRVATREPVPEVFEREVK